MFEKSSDQDSRRGPGFAPSVWKLEWETLVGEIMTESGLFKHPLSKPEPDAALTAVVGKDPLPRTELTKKLWEYIRKHEIRDPKDKRSISADEKLLAVFDGKKVVSMFEMTKLVNGHLV
jgi:hypothetical protein